MFLRIDNSERKILIMQIKDINLIFQNTDTYKLKAALARASLLDPSNYSNICSLFYCPVLIEFSLESQKPFFSIVDKFSALTFRVLINFQVDPVPKDPDPPVKLWQIRNSAQGRELGEVDVSLERKDLRKCFGVETLYIHISFLLQIW